MNTSTSTETLQTVPAMDAAVAGIDLTAAQTPQSASILLPSSLKPDHETQLRPLAGLPLDQAQLAWERAVEKAGGRKITGTTRESRRPDQALVERKPSHSPEFSLPED